MIEIRIAAELRSLIDVMNIKEGEERVVEEVHNNRCKPDIVLSGHRIAIDIDGSFWHRGKRAKDKSKLDLMADHGWKLIRVREYPLKKIGAYDIDCKSLEDIKDVVDKILLRLQTLDVSIPDVQVYLAKREPQNQEAADTEIARRGCGVDPSTALAALRPDIAKQWHPTRNGELTADMVTVWSNRKVWWKCENGHEWGAVVAHRARPESTGCPFCSGRRTLPGFNDLATLRPDIAAQWHPTKNGELTPDMVTVGSNRKVWWQCEDGHEWEAQVQSRAKVSGTSCPTCRKNKRSNIQPTAA
jgi:very-short-patch-repair endonuclease/translation initiation factor IF-1